MAKGKFQKIKNDMKILVFGSSGQISSELKKFKNVLCLSKNEANFLYPDKIYKIIHQIKPIGIINGLQCHID